MASTAVAVQGVHRRGWIISQKDDLIWFIGSVAASYAFLAGNLILNQLGMSVMILTWVWALGFDGPHIFATISRTYADREERRQRSRLLYGSLMLFLLGPSLVLADRLLGTTVLGPIFFLFASTWAYYHLVKQHYGFMILYKKKNDDLADVDNSIDRAFILLGMTYPFLHFLGHSVAASERVPSTLSGVFWWLETMTLAAFVIVAALFLGRQVQRAISKRGVNMPKLLLLAAALPMHWIVLRALEPMAPASAGALAAVATLTIYHNIQYHRIVWFHNRNKYGRDDSADFGAASAISKTLSRYIGAALLFGMAYHIPHYTIIPPDGLSAAFIWGGAFVHYYLDGKIWRVRRDKQLTRNLQMATAGADAGR